MKDNQLISVGLAFGLTVSILNAQQTSSVCSNPTAYTTIHANNIKAGLLNAGDMFWDFNDAQFIPNPTPGGPNPATIFAAGMWIGGVDPGGNLGLATVTYRPGGVTDYWAGPLDESGITDEFTCSNWDRFFRAKGADIKSFLDNLPDLVNNPSSAIADYKDVMGWPGRGNPYFTDIWGFDLPFTQQNLASFHDENQDGSYDPLQGDYPVVKLQGKPEFVPAEIVWCVFNDQGGGAEHSNSHGNPLQIEVQLTVWAFNDPNQPVLNNTLFTAHKMINRNQYFVDSCFWGIWVDFDLGCYTDDYIGCAPDQDAFYAYNQDPVDGTSGTTCDGGVATFGFNPPVQSATFLSRSLDKFIYYNNAGVGNPFAATTDPNLPIEYYRYLTGRWRDGSPYTNGGSGYQSGSIPVDYAFPDLPDDPNGWSMCTADLPFGDRRVMGIHKIGQFVPGQIEELVTAWTVHPGPELPCGLGTTLDDIADLHDLYADGFAGVQSPLTAIPDIVEAPISIFPNPAANVVRLEYGDLPVREIRLFSSDGKFVQTWNNIQSGQTVLNVGGLSNGVYALQLLTERGVAVKKIAVLK